jgi:hypothetical protein
MTFDDLRRAGAFDPALKDWKQYGDTTKMLAFILEYGVQVGSEADLLVELLRPVKITGKDRTISKTREIMRHYKNMMIVRDAYRSIGEAPPSLEIEYERLAKHHNIEPESFKKTIQREKKK